MSLPDVRGILVRDLQRTLAGDVLDRGSPGAVRVAVALSGGVDSLSVLYALLELGFRPTVYSFTLEDRESTDFRVARSEAGALGLPFIPVVLPTDLRLLPAWIREAAAGGLPPRKAATECQWAMQRLFRSVRERWLALGWSAEDHFGLSKSAQLHWKDRIQEWRDHKAATEKLPGSQWHYMVGQGRRRGFDLLDPFGCQEMRDAFRGTSWAEVNRPRQKEPVARAFPEHFTRSGARPHQNFQLGDAGIAELWSRLLDVPELNVLRRKAPAALYRDVVEGRAGAWPPGNVSQTGGPR